MFKFAALFPCLFLVLCLAPGQPVSGDETLMENVSYSDVTGLGHTAADHRLVYGQDDPALQYGLLWIPGELAAQARAPRIVLVHGGCWLNAYDIRHSLPLASALAGAGVEAAPGVAR